MTIIDTLLNADAAPASAPVAEQTFSVQIKRFLLRLIIDRVARVVPTRESMPVLKNLRFDAGDGLLSVTATDTELTMISTTELVDIASCGVAYFPAKRLAEIVRAAEGDTVDISVSGLKATITIGRTTWELKLVTGADWPPTPVAGDVDFHQLDRTTFLAALNTVRYAAARDSRTSLMMINVRDGRMTACDGVRLQQVRVPELTVDLPIPIGAVDDLARLLGDSEQQLFSLSVTDNTLVFTVGVDTLIVRRLIAQPPDVEAQILRPALANDQCLTVERAALTNAVKRVRINADTTTSAIVLTLNPASGDQGPNVTITTCDTQANAATETIDADWQGPTRTVVVHHAFLLDALAVRRDPSATICLGPDSRTRPSALLLRDESDTFGVVPQMRADWVSQ